jgi:hypothetical protein
MLEESNAARTRQIHSTLEGQTTPKSWTSDYGGLRLWVGYHKWPPKADREEYERRPIVFSVMDSAQHVVAKGELQEWEFNYPPEGHRDEDGYRFGIPSAEQFFYAADNHSNNAVNAADVFRKFWKQRNWVDESPFAYGNVVVFDRLQIDAKTAAQSDAVWALINKFIDRQFRKNRWTRASMILLKPFPLEFENNITDENEAAFKHRRAAMIRLYGRRMKAKLLSDDIVWMWVNINCPIKPRKPRKAVKRSGKEALK